MKTEKTAFCFATDLELAELQKSYPSFVAFFEFCCIFLKVKQFMHDLGIWK